MSYGKTYSEYMQQITDFKKGVVQSKEHYNEHKAECTVEGKCGRCHYRFKTWKSAENDLRRLVYQVQRAYPNGG